jgi:LacI family transcriptional regulator
MNMPTKPPRLKSVAEIAGVSIAAASRILRGDTSQFTPQTCDRVRAAAKQIGWRRNLLVTSIQTGRTRTIGVVIPPYDSFWVALLSGINSRLARDDYLPINVWPANEDNFPYFESPERESVLLLNRLLDRRVDALMLWPDFAQVYDHHTRELGKSRVPVPVVMIDYEPQSEGCDTVSTDEAQAMRSVVDHLVSLGHHRLAYLSGREAPAQTWATERREGFVRAVATHRGVSAQTFKLNATGTNGVEVATEILTGSRRPTAIATATDHEAANVYVAAAKLGIPIPQELSVIGFADLDFAEWMTPPLTTVRQHAREIGLRAANLVLRRLDGSARDTPSTRERVGTTLVHRGSTARPSGSP